MVGKFRHKVFDGIGIGKVQVVRGEDLASHSPCLCFIQALL